MSATFPPMDFVKQNSFKAVLLTAAGLIATPIAAFLLEVLPPPYNNWDALQPIIGMLALSAFAAILMAFIVLDLLLKFNGWWTEFMRCRKVPWMKKPNFCGNCGRGKEALNLVSTHSKYLQMGYESGARFWKESTDTAFCEDSYDFSVHSEWGYRKTIWKCQSCEGHVIMEMHLDKPSNKWKRGYPKISD